MRKRVGAVALVVMAASAVSPGAVFATPPVGTCPPPFELFTFDPSQSSALDMNGNHALCVLTLENNPIFGVNVIDDVAQVP
jgi:hypothetical protein